MIPINKKCDTNIANTMSSSDDLTSITVVNIIIEIYVTNIVNDSFTIVDPIIVLSPFN